jgi:glycosyltransferase involved in cell wall biosynthesis
MLSIITPCKRIHNLPAIYQSILDLNNSNVEWLVIYDSNIIDEKILVYQERIPIRLFNVLTQSGDTKGQRQRNLGIENASGEYLYFLDDDNIIYPNLLRFLENYLDGNKIIIVNQLVAGMTKRMSHFTLDSVKPNIIDTAQFLIPSKYKSIKWTNEDFYNEYPYIRDVLKLSNNNYVWVGNGYSYYNYLRWNKLHGSF